MRLWARSRALSSEADPRAGDGEADGLRRRLPDAAEQRHLDTRRAHRIAGEQVGDGEADRVHGAGDRDSEALPAMTSGILQRRQRA